MKLIKIHNPENASEEEVAAYAVSYGVRAIVNDQDGNIGMVYISKRKHHKLVGGEIEKGETVQGALKRECLEELGCNIEVLGEVGQIIEYRKMSSLKKISYCYLAKVIGLKSNVSFTQEELDSGIQSLWLPIDEAIKVLAIDKPTDLEGSYIIAREKAFLEAVKFN